MFEILQIFSNFPVISEIQKHLVIFPSNPTEIVTMAVHGQRKRIRQMFDGINLDNFVFPVKNEDLVRSMFLRADDIFQKNLRRTPDSKALLAFAHLLSCNCGKDDCGQCSEPIGEFIADVLLSHITYGGSYNCNMEWPISVVDLQRVTKLMEYACLMAKEHFSLKLKAPADPIKEANQALLQAAELLIQKVTSPPWPGEFSHEAIFLILIDFFIFSEKAVILKAANIVALIDWMTQKCSTQPITSQWVTMIFQVNHYGRVLDCAGRLTGELLIFLNKKTAREGHYETVVYALFYYVKAVVTKICEDAPSHYKDLKEQLTSDVMKNGMDIFMEKLKCFLKMMRAHQDVNANVTVPGIGTVEYWPTNNGKFLCELMKTLQSRVPVTGDKSFDECMVEIMKGILDLLNEWFPQPFRNVKRNQKEEKLPRVLNELMNSEAASVQEAITIGSYRYPDIDDRRIEAHQFLTTGIYPNTSKKQ